MIAQWISRKDKVIVIASWLGLVAAIRFAFYAFLPNWLGGLGALALGFVVMWAILSTPKAAGYRQRFNRVMRYWYTRKLRYFTIVLGIAGASLLILTEYVLWANPEEFKQFNTTVLIKTGDMQVMRQGLWIFLYEDIEFYLFFFLIKKGLLFKVRENVNDTLL